MRVRLPPPAQQLFDPAALVKWDHISLSRRSQGFDSPMWRSGPVAQSGESTDLIHRRARVQIPPGPPAQTRGGVAQRQSGSLIRSRPLVRSRAPSPRQSLSACPSGKGLACKAGIRGFDSRRRLHGAVAQIRKSACLKRKRSSVRVRPAPPPDQRFYHRHSALVAQRTEHRLAEPGAVGSIPTGRSDTTRGRGGTRQTRRA